MPDDLFDAMSGPVPTLTVDTTPVTYTAPEGDPTARVAALVPDTPRGGFREVIATVNLWLPAPLKGSVTLGGNWTFPTDADPTEADATRAWIIEQAAKQYFETIHAQLAELTAAGTAAVAQTLPAPAHTGYATTGQLAQPAAAAAPAGVPTATPAQAAVNAAVNGPAGAATSGAAWLGVPLVEYPNKYGKGVLFPGSAATERQVEDAAKQLAQATLGIHPDHMRAYDCRKDIVTGNDRHGNAGKLVVAQKSPLSGEFGNRAVAWVNWDRSGQMVVEATKEAASLIRAYAPQFAAPIAAGQAAGSWGQQQSGPVPF